MGAFGSACKLYEQDPAYVHDILFLSRSYLRSCSRTSHAMLTLSQNILFICIAIKFLIVSTFSIKHIELVLHCVPPVSLSLFPVSLSCHLAL